jgi:pimeloyl-ACP methyl ester carboxylesterase
MWQKLRAVPVDQLLLIVGLVLILFAFVALRQRGQKHLPKAELPLQTWPQRLRRGLSYSLRLLAFAIVAFILIGGVVMVYVDYQMVTADIAPAHHPVARPADMTLPVEDVYFIGGDGLTMAGWYLPPQNGATIILLHGYGGDRTGMLWHAHTLYKAGFGVLAYDERASGESAGDYRSFGWEDAADVGGAIAFVHGRSHDDSHSIGIAGCSIGGQIALQGAAAYPEIGAVWADGPAVILAKDNPPPQNWAEIILVVSGYIVDWMYEQRLDVTPPPAMIDMIGDIAPRPIMLVGGGQPHSFFGSEEPHINFYAEHAGDTAVTWTIEEAYHCDGPAWQPDTYAERLVTFFETSLLEG